MSTAKPEILVKHSGFFKSVPEELYFWLISTRTAFVSDGQAEIIISQGSETKEGIVRLEKTIARAKYLGSQLYNAQVIISSDLVGAKGPLAPITPRQLPDGLWFAGLSELLYLTDRGKLIFQLENQ
jgi:hypothetical protein